MQDVLPSAAKLAPAPLAPHNRQACLDSFVISPQSLPLNLTPPNGGADFGIRETVTIVKCESSTGSNHLTRLALACSISNVLGMHMMFGTNHEEMRSYSRPSSSL